MAHGSGDRHRDERRSRRSAALVVIVTAAALVMSLLAVPSAAERPTGPGMGKKTTSSTADATSTTVGSTTSTTRHDWAACIIGACNNNTTTTTTPGQVVQEQAAPATECLPMAKAGGGTWECSFSDEFDGTSLDLDKWFIQTRETAATTREKTYCHTDGPDVIRVEDGALHLSAVRRSEPFDCYGFYTTDIATGQVSTMGKFSQAYGRFEVRARVTGAKEPGLQEAIWMWPDKPVGLWPGSGEIDIAEIYHQYPDRAIPYVHYNNTADPNVTNNFCMIDDIHDFHTYVLEWTPKRIKVIYDGYVCIDDPWVPLLPYTGRQPFDKPFFLVLTQALGVGGNAGDPATTQLPASMIVDYVRAWR